MEFQVETRGPLTHASCARLLLSMTCALFKKLCARAHRLSWPRAHVRTLRLAPPTKKKKLISDSRLVARFELEVERAQFFEP